MRVAIIDDGICEAYLNMKIEHFCLKNGEIIKVEETVKNQLTHGTVCAVVLNQIAESTNLIDIKIFGPQNATCNDIIIALEWCYKESIEVINMSFGTINYLDILKLRESFQKNIWNGSIIVAAHNNYCINAYPAIERNVIGVRRDEGKVLLDGEFGNIMCNGLRFENCFIIHYDIKKNLHNSELIDSNSFAAPVMTGHVVNYLSKNKSADFAKVLEYLKSLIKSNGCISEIVEKNYSNTFVNVNTPIIAFDCRNSVLCNDLKIKLIEKGYSVVVFCEKPRNDTDVPIEFYCDATSALNYDIISTLELTYEMDIFFLCLDPKRYRSNYFWKIVDLYIDKNKNIYSIDSNNDIRFFIEIDEIFYFIIKYFNSVS